MVFNFSQEVLTRITQNYGAVTLYFFSMMAARVGICCLFRPIIKRVPDEHRKIKPNMVWLFIIPFFNLVWSFFLFPRIAASYKSYFDSQNITNEGDCGARLSLIYCIVFCTLQMMFFIPYLSTIASIIFGTSFGMMMGTFLKMKNRIPKSA